MARKRASRDRGDSASPNRVLIVFLVIFILTTFGLGGWVYSLFGQRKLGEDAKLDGEVKKKNAAALEKWVMLQLYEMRAMNGDAPMLDEKSTDNEQWRTLRAKALDPGPEIKFIDSPDFKDFEKDRKPFEETLKAAYADLGWNKDAHKYVKGYRTENERLRGELKKAQDLLYALQQERDALNAKVTGLTRTASEERKKMFDAIKGGNDAALAAASARTEEMKTAIERNTTLNDQIGALNVKYKADMDRKDRQIIELEKELAQRGNGGAEKGPKGAPTPAVEAHALVLDISKGKPLWDQPRGKIVRIEEKERRVFIDKGAQDGVRPQLTFMVFGAGWGNRPEGAFKGTIEVTRVEPKMSVARITSLYDAQGNEISLNDPSPTKIIREGNNPWKENDLIFNLAWGTHVAIAGVVDWSGRASEAATAQAEDLADFIRVLTNQGVVVDAYVDMKDGQVKGKLTHKTAYLIQGQKAWSAAKDPGPRIQAINEARTKLHKDAVERGLFIISPDNFANVIGYRRPRSKTDVELSGFRPSTPAGGPALALGPAKGGDAAPPPELTGKWGGKIVGAGQLRLSFKGDGGVVWQLVEGKETLTGYSKLTSAGQEVTAVIQNRPMTLRLVNAGQNLRVTGQNFEATLSRE
ncbi:MAG: hypothetical protein L0Z62_43950 [Gemmataceae bacterium]|nr:hypothetical protein [Gemmataceae bacterium]